LDGLEEARESGVHICTEMDVKNAARSRAQRAKVAKSLGALQSAETIRRFWYR
jgi:hypothetical protein